MLAGGRLSGAAGQRIGSARLGTVNRVSGGAGAGGSSSPHRGDCWAARDATCRKIARTPSTDLQYMSPDPRKKRTPGRSAAPAPPIRKSGARGGRLDLHPDVRGSAAGRVVGGQRYGPTVATRLHLLEVDSLGHQVGPHRVRLEVTEVLILRRRPAGSGVRADLHPQRG